MDDTLYTKKLSRAFWKPSPVGFEKIMETLKPKPENMVYVADNEQKDFIAPNKLRFFTVQLIRPARIHCEVGSDPYAPAKHVISTLNELPPLLCKI